MCLRGQAAGQGQYGAHLLLGYGSTLHAPGNGSGHVPGPSPPPNSNQEGCRSPHLPETVYREVEYTLQLHVNLVTPRLTSRIRPDNIPVSWGRGTPFLQGEEGRSYPNPHMCCIPNPLLLSLAF